MKLISKASIVVSFVAFSSSVWADPTAYTAVQNTSTGAIGYFGETDLTTGVFTQIGGQLADPLNGLGESPSGTIYGYGIQGSLYKMNTATGAETLIGTGSLKPGDLSFAFGSTANGSLYAVNITTSDQFDLYGIDASDGAATYIGLTGLVITGSAFNNIDLVGVSNGSSTFYITSNSNLYSVDTLTGLATQVGSGMGSAAGWGLGAMLAKGGTLYGGSWATDANVTQSLVTLNPATSAATFQSSLSGLPPSTQIFGLASAPEPAPFVVVGLGALGLLIRRKRK